MFKTFKQRLDYLLTGHIPIPDPEFRLIVYPEPGYRNRFHIVCERKRQDPAKPKIFRWTVVKELHKVRLKGPPKIFGDLIRPPWSRRGTK